MEQRKLLPWRLLAILLKVFTSTELRSLPMRVSVLLFSLLFAMLPMASFAQCLPDTTLEGNLEISPDSLTDAVGCQYYEEVISFVLPRDTMANLGGIPILANFSLLYLLNKIKFSIRVYL